MAVLHNLVGGITHIAHMYKGTSGDASAVQLQFLAKQNKQNEGDGSQECSPRCFLTRMQLLPGNRLILIDFTSNARFVSRSIRE